MNACPICARPAEAAYRPFCSRRCADVDLGRWFNGSYRLPSFRAEEDEQEEHEDSASNRVDPGTSIG